MPIQLPTPKVIPAVAEQVAPVGWIDRLAVNGSTDSVNAEYDLSALTADGKDAGRVGTFLLSDVLTLAKQPDRPKLAEALAAIYEAVQEDQDIRASGTTTESTE